MNPSRRQINTTLATALTLSNTDRFKTHETEPAITRFCYFKPAPEI